MMWSSHHSLPKKWRMTVTAIVNVRRLGSARTSCGKDRAVSIKSANERRAGAIAIANLLEALRWLSSTGVSMRPMLDPNDAVFPNEKMTSASRRGHQKRRRERHLALHNAQLPTISAARSDFSVGPLAATTWAV